MQDTDLNLIPAAYALLSEQSVTKAADRLYLSIPATSRALDRCRRLFGDELLVRHGRGVVITPRGQEVLQRITPLVEAMNSLLVEHQPFDPTTLRQRFVISANEAVIAALGGALIQRIAAEAPRVEIRFSQEAADDMELLSRGELSMGIGSFGDLTSEFDSEALAVEHMVGVIRADHPFAEKRITMARYASMDHIVVSRRGRTTGPIDEHLATVGRQRHISAVVPTFAAALAMCLQSDSTTLAPSRLAVLFHRSTGLVVFDPPFALPTVDVRSVWHRRFQNDPAHCWLRSIVTKTATRLSRS
jgi:DNA-binding transcriptional LysR family regulator